MGSFSLMHWVIVLVVILFLFGAGRVADIGKGLGEGIKNFKKGLADADDPKPEPRAAAEVPAAAAPALTEGKRKKVIQVEVDEDADAEEIARAAKSAGQKAKDERA